MGLVHVACTHASILECEQLRDVSSHHRIAHHVEGARRINTWRVRRVRAPAVLVRATRTPVRTSARITCCARFTCTTDMHICAQRSHVHVAHVWLCAMNARVHACKQKASALRAERHQLLPRRRVHSSSALFGHACSLTFIRAPCGPHINTT